MTDLAQAFRNDLQLKQYVLKDVVPTNKKLGTGSFGSVEEMTMRRNGEEKICAAKKLHDILVEEENEGVTRMVSKYLRECQLMSSLRHPNITEFYGICFVPTSRLPLLVMERLDTSLGDYLENGESHLSLSQKVSILSDVALGLVYLHGWKPSPIIHRDLSANNVLINFGPPLIAKISDLGNSRIVDMQPEAATKLSVVPGTTVYMPPEAMDGEQRYGPSLDIFSFGHLALYTFIHIFPGNLLPSTFINPADKKVVARSEVERRKDFIDVLKSKLSHNQALISLIEQCLHNDPQQRPSAKDLLEQLNVSGPKTAKDECCVLMSGEQPQSMKVSMSRELILSAPIQIQEGRCSSVCLHPVQKLAVSVHEASLGENLYYSVFPVGNEAEGKILTPPVQYDAGKHPSVTLVHIENGDTTIAIATHRSRLKKDIFYRIGNVNMGKEMIEWHCSVPMNKGVKPKISSSRNGTIVVIYEEAFSLSKIQYRMGRVTLVVPTIDWEKEQYIPEFDGVEPDISISDTNIVAICRSGLAQLKTKVGVFQPDMSISWGPTVPIQSIGINPSISINSSGYVVESHQTVVLRRICRNHGQILPTSVITWKEDSTSTDGEYPTISMNDSNLIFEMHKSKLGHKILYLQGELCI